jgi:hypothetical protein
VYVLIHLKGEFRDKCFQHKTIAQLGLALLTHHEECRLSTDGVIARMGEA